VDYKKAPEALFYWCYVHFIDRMSMALQRVHVISISRLPVIAKEGSFRLEVL
jgi:hypothetical protein